MAISPVSGLYSSPISHRYVHSYMCAPACSLSMRVKPIHDMNKNQPPDSRPPNGHMQSFGGGGRRSPGTLDGIACRQLPA